MCTLWHALMQIIFEVFPISSSGHLLLLEYVGGFASVPPCIYYILHIPMVLIIGIRGLHHIRLSKDSRKEWFLYGLLMVWYGFCALVGTSVIYFLLHRYIDSTKTPLALGFVITALMLLSLLFVKTNDDKQVTWWRTLCIGLIQAIAFFPGVSRLASTYVAGRLFGFSAKKSFWFSWWIGLPIMSFGILSGLIDDFSGGYNTNVAHMFFMQPCIWFGIIICTVIAYVGFVCIEYAAKKELLWYFSLYMLIPIICTLFIGVVK